MGFLIYRPYIFSRIKQLMNRIGETCGTRVIKLKQYGELEAYNGNQYRTRIILECFITTF